MVSVSGSVVSLNIIMLVMLKLCVKVVICEVIIRFEVDIMVIIMNMS